MGKHSIIATIGFYHGTRILFVQELTSCALGDIFVSFYFRHQQVSCTWRWEMHLDLLGQLTITAISGFLADHGNHGGFLLTMDTMGTQPVMVQTAFSSASSCYGSW